MSVINMLHNKSMEFAELALMARIRGDIESSINLFKQALKYELDAIAKLEADGIIEPTFSVLHRSAGTLALDCNEVRKAEQIVARALSYDPPAEIAEELRDLLEKINFRRHLELRGIILEEDEMQMNLAGRGVGFGVVNSNEFISRVNTSSKLIYRIVERRRNKEFREASRIKKNIKDDYELFVSTPRAASFSVTLKLGRPTGQRFIPGMLDTSAVIIDEFMDLMDLVSRLKFQEIQERIPDPAYFRNFVALAKNMAPDGETVRQVGFTVFRGGSERFVEVAKSAKEFPSPSIEKMPVESEIVEVHGVLRYADATGDRGLIKVVGEDGGTTYNIKVPEGMMSDIVRPMWDSVVTIKGKREGRIILLEDIKED